MVSLSHSIYPLTKPEQNSHDMPPNSFPFFKRDQIVLKKYTCVPNTIMKRVTCLSIYLLLATYCERDILWIGKL